MQQDTSRLKQQADGLMRSVLDDRLFQVAGQDVYVHSDTAMRELFPIRHRSTGGEND